MADAPTTPHAPDEPAPTWRDGRVRALLLLAFALQLLAWQVMGGYQLADSIEYVENARALVRGHDVVDSRAIRSFVFPILLAPPVWLADMLGLEDQRFVMIVLRLVQMAIGLGLVLATVRLGTRMHSPRAGLVAGFAVAVNPVFLQYTVSPLTEIAAALGVALGLGSLAGEPTRRRTWHAGLCVGAAMMISYKTIMVAFAIGLVLLLRHRIKERGLWLGYLAGLVVCVLAQVVVDKLTYGEWGYSAWRYFSANFGPQFGALFWKPASWIGDSWPWLSGQLARIGKWFYDLYAQASEIGGAVIGEQIQEGTKGQGKLWYLRTFHEMVVVPLLLLMGLGAACALPRKQGRGRLLIAIILVYFGMTLLKGSKDHRLYLPILPVFASLVGWGYALVAGRTPIRRALAVALLFGGLALGLHQLFERNTRRYVGFWQAMDHVNALQEGREEPTRVASAYHWAVFLREAPGVVLTKLPHQLDGWASLPPAERNATLLTLLQQDWFFAHLPVLTHPDHVDLMRVVGREFAVETVLWDHADFQEVGPVLVMRRRTGAPDERVLHDRLEEVDPAAFARAEGLGDPVPFVRATGGAQLTHLGFAYEPLGDGSIGWMTTYTWTESGDMDVDWNGVQRITTTDESSVFQRNHPLAWGVHPTSTWRPGTLVVEGFPVVAAAEPFGRDKPWRPMGGAYRRGDRMLANLWTYYVDVRTDEAGAPYVAERLERARRGSTTPLRVGDLADALESPDGIRWSLEGLTTVGRFLLPVHPDARLPDDGQPVPE